MVYGVLTYSYKNVPLSSLYNYDIAADSVDMHQSVKTLVFKTCSRIELYCYSEDYGDVENFLSETRRKHSEREEGEILIGSGAVRHLFRVASGLESIILGESEIIGQLRHTFNEYKIDELHSKQLEYLFENAMRVGRKTRREAGISNRQSGLYHAAATIVLENYLPNMRIAVVGSGFVSKNLLAELKIANPNIKVTVFSREAAHAERLARLFGMEYSDFKIEMLKNYNIVFSAIKNGTGINLSGPKFIIDLSVPRAFAGANVLHIEDVIRKTGILQSNMNLGLAEGIIEKEMNGLLGKDCSGGAALKRIL